MFEREGCGIDVVSRECRVVRMVGAGEARGLTGFPDETFGATVAESKVVP